MFDIGFTELLLVGVVALLVVGPERLPDVVRTTLRYVRQFKQSFSHIRDEVERELALDDVKKDLQAGKKQVSDAVGLDDFHELHDSLDELRRETQDLRNIDSDSNDNSKSVEGRGVAVYAEDDFSDAAIEADLASLARETGPQLPNPDAEADTPEEKTDP